MRNQFVPLLDFLLLIAEHREVIPYKDTSKDKGESGDVASTMSTTLPMVAVSLPYSAFVTNILAR